MRRPYAWFPGKRAVRDFMKTSLAILPQALPETISSAATFSADAHDDSRKHCVHFAAYTAALQ